MPGLRVLSSPKFRMLLASLLAIFGAVAHVVFFALLAAAGSDEGHDFIAYYGASLRLVDGALPFAANQLDGSFDAVCVGCYLYPPLLAQVLMPLAQLPVQVATNAWWVVQLLAMLGSVWIATGLGGARCSFERVLWCLVAVLWFMPVFHSLFYGNVSTVLALGVTLVAAGGAAAGLGAAVLAVIKVVPATLLPAAFLIGRTSRWTLVASLVVILGISLALAPDAWLEYPGVLLSLLTGFTDYPNNIAPANIALQAGLPGFVVDLVRLLALAAGVLAVAVSAWLAHKRDGVKAAALMGTLAMLLIPAAIWFHYLAMLLPFSAMAWPRAGAAIRAALLGSAALLVPGLVMPAVALAGAVCLSLVEAWALWPRGSAASDELGAPSRIDSAMGS